jgi:hypothetical protein
MLEAIILFERATVLESSREREEREEARARPLVHAGRPGGWVHVSAPEQRPAAPTLFKPGDRAGFKMREIVDFDWNDQNNAWCYHLQMDDDPGFAGYPAYGELCTPNSFWRQSAFGPVGSTTYWRVRAQDASGNGGPWSPVRSFVIKD